MKLSLKNKLTILIVLIIFFFGTLTALSVYFYTKKVFLFDKEKAVIENSIRQSRRAEEVFSKFIELTKIISIEKFAIDFLESNQKGPNKEVEDHLDHFNSSGDFSAIFLMNKEEAEIVVSTDESFLGGKFAFRRYFQRALLDGYGIDMAMGRISKQLGYYFSQSIISPNDKDEILGVAVMKVLPDAIHRTVINLGEKNDDTMLVNEDGIIVHSSNKDKLYKSVGDLSKEVRESSKSRFFLKEVKSLGYNKIQGMIESARSGDLEGYIEKSKEKILSVSKIRKTPFFIVMERDVENYLGSILNTAKILALFVSLAALTASAFIYFLINRVLSPLRELEKAVADTKGGKFALRFKIKSKDEIGQLAIRFKKVINELQRSKSGIESEVKKRTSELESLNKNMVNRELKMIELKKEIKKIKGK